jgi:hypothetical protein
MGRLGREGLYIGARGPYGKGNRNGGAVLERNGQADKGEEANDTKEGVRSRRFLDD